MVLPDLKVTTVVYRYTTHTIFLFQVEFRHFSNYRYVVMLQVNLLANYLLHLSEINQMNRENKYTEGKRTFSQVKDNNNQRHLV